MELEKYIQRTKKVTMEEHDWEKHWIEFKKWTIVNDKWRWEAMYFQKEKNREYIYALLVAGFDGLKEEATKFIVSYMMGRYSYMHS